MRKNKSSVPSYGISEKYIYDSLEGYLYTYEDISEDDSEMDDSDDPPRKEDISYGGYWYNKGKQSRQDLYSFYEHFGFHEEPKIHTHWKCYSDIPLPTMICPLKK